MNRDTLPDGHHGKNHPPRLNWQSYRGKRSVNPDDNDDDANLNENADLNDYLRSQGRTVQIKDGDHEHQQGQER